MIDGELGAFTNINLHQAPDAEAKVPTGCLLSRVWTVLLSVSCNAFLQSTRGDLQSWQLEQWRRC